jgi:hypothetical protein
LISQAGRRALPRGWLPIDPDLENRPIMRTFQVQFLKRPARKFVAKKSQPD